MGVLSGTTSMSRGISDTTWCSSLIDCLKNESILQAFG